MGPPIPSEIEVNSFRTLIVNPSIRWGVGVVVFVCIVIFFYARQNHINRSPKANTTNSRISSEPSALAPVSRDIATSDIATPGESDLIDTFNVPESFVELIDIVPLDSRTGRLTPDFLELIGVRSRVDRLRVQKAMDSFLDEFGEVKTRNATLVQDDGGSFIRLAPCNHETGTAFYNLNRSLEGTISKSSVPLAIALMRKEFRNGGTKAMELGFLNDGPADPTFRLHLSYLGKSGGVKSSAEVGENLDSPDVTTYKRWAHLTALLRR
jgi:hypothetical protein